MWKFKIFNSNHKMVNISHFWVKVCCLLTSRKILFLKFYQIVKAIYLYIFFNARQGGYVQGFISSIKYCDWNKNSIKSIFLFNGFFFHWKFSLKRIDFWVLCFYGQNKLIYYYLLTLRHRLDGGTHMYSISTLKLALKLV